MLRPQYLLDLNHELIIDNFAGGGGASTGIELALGRHVDIAINHDEKAIAMHTANHPQTKHFCESVWDIDPREVTHGRPVGLVWLSPDCKHFSKAKGGKPVEKKIRIAPVTSGIPFLGYVIWPQHISAGAYIRGRYHRTLRQHESGIYDRSQALNSYKAALAHTGVTI